MSLSSILNAFKRAAPGQLYLKPAPTADPGTATVASTTDGYYALFYGSGGKAAKKTLTGGVTPWGNLTDDGLTFKVTPSEVEFSPNNAAKTKINTGIDSADVNFDIYDVDPAHVVDLFGSQAADLLTVASAAGVAGRSIAVVGPNALNQLYTAMYRVPDPTFAGEYWHLMLFAVNLRCEVDMKLSKKDALKMKVMMSLEGSPFMNNSQGYPAAFAYDIPTAAAS